MLEFFQNAIIYVGSFMLVLGVVVFVHEFGHFRVGRWCGIAVKSFSIGLGGEWFGWTDKHGTRWKVSKIPLGGFVSWIDDTDGSSTLPASEENQALAKEEARRRGHFRAMPIWKRAAATAAGPAANFVFSIFALGLLAFVVGGDRTDLQAIPARLAFVAEQSAAAEAGLQQGDVIVSANGQRIANFSELQAIVAASPLTPLAIEVERGGALLAMSATPQRASANAGRSVREGQGLLGVSGPLILDAERNLVRYNPFEAIGIGARDTWAIVAQTFGYIGAIFVGRESGDQIAGPLGIINVSGQVAASALQSPDAGLGEKLQVLALSLLRLAAFLSVAVGIVNILPIPILDGGHLVFYGIEALRGGRPLPPTAQEWAYRAGFAVMASLFLFATWNDITRLFPGTQ
ncbi:MAG TPA: RIP metalloprotease RseP [Hyphomonadaceae bacterium]|nr:RIP metalloprotease RseP [Hyphomonadaceae bacterium]